jgi:LysR family nod box-dependent transcriptional activator
LGVFVRLNHFDLNLLVALDALLTEQSTTRAGKRINLSQPAMSCALARLRSYFNDPLLSQVGRNLVPTPLGASLAQPVRELLLRTEATLDSRPIFDPATARRTFKLLMSDYVSTVLMAELTTRAEHIAPHLSFEILPLGLNSISAVESGDVDLLLMPDQFLPSGIRSEVLFEEHYVCVAWSGNHAGRRSHHAARSTCSSATWSRARCTPAAATGSVDELFFQRQGLERRVETVVGEFSVLPQYVVGSTRIATMHNRLAQLYAGYMPLKILPIAVRPAHHPGGGGLEPAPRSGSGPGLGAQPAQERLPSTWRSAPRSKHTQRLMRVPLARMRLAARVGSIDRESARATGGINRALEHFSAARARRGAWRAVHADDIILAQ